MTHGWALLLTAAEFWGLLGTIAAADWTWSQLRHRGKHGRHDSPNQ